MSQLEKAARAFIDIYMPGMASKRLTSGEKSALLSDCMKAALIALREPDEGMIKAGEAALFEHMPEAQEWTLSLMKEAWQAVIDHLTGGE